MGIPEKQLETWSNQGAVATSKATHEAIRNVLAADDVLGRKNLEVYLQGSYKNTTNIRGDSDVDLVVQLNDTFSRNLSLLPGADRQRYEAAHSDASYTWWDLRGDVFRALREAYGADAVKQGKKSIKVAAGSGRLAADVVPAVQYRNYLWFEDYQDQGYIEGIKFYAEGVRPVVNYPKQHYDNGTKKNGAERTNGWYKHTIRMFKNARNRAVEKGLIPAGTAPSYFLECLLHNVPDSCYGGTFQDTYVNCVNWLAEADLELFMCQNDQLALFGSTPEQWTTASAEQLIDGLTDLWNNW